MNMITVRHSLGFGTSVESMFTVKLFYVLPYCLTLSKSTQSPAVLSQIKILICFIGYFDRREC